MPVLADVPIVSRDNGLLSLSLRLENPTAKDIKVVTITDWMDGAGRPVATVMSTPRHVTVPRYGDTFLSGVAPRGDIVSFHVRVEPDPTVDAL